MTNWVLRLANAIADLITRAKGLNDTHDDLGTHEASQATHRAVLVDIHDTDLPVVKTVVDGIQTDLSNATDGLGALKALIDILTGYVDTEVAAILAAVDTEVGSILTIATGIQTDLDNATDGLGALKALIDNVDADLVAHEASQATHRAVLIDIHDTDLPAVDGKVSYTEASASGNSGGDGAWHDAIDVDTRGMKSFSAVVHNTDGANSLNWRLKARPSDYAGGADEEIPECPGSETLAAGEKGLAELLKAYSRIKIQVQDTVAMSAATYTINYLVNR